MEHRWNDTERRNGTAGGKPVPVPRCPPHITWAGLGSNPGLGGEKPATNRLSHGTANLRKNRLKHGTANLRKTA